jgi:hypothetical protein
VIDESDSQYEKHFDPRISILLGISISDNPQRFRINFCWRTSIKSSFSTTKISFPDSIAEQYINVTEYYTESVHRITWTEVEVPEAVTISKTVRRNDPKNVMKSVPMIEKKETKQMVTQQVEIKCKKTRVVPKC